MVFSTWTLTKGQFFRILTSIVLVLAPTMVLTLVKTSPVLPSVAAAPLALLLSVVNAFVEVPLVCGLYAFLYRGLRPVGSAASTALA